MLIVGKGLIKWGSSKLKQISFHNQLCVYLCVYMCLGGWWWWWGLCYGFMMNNLGVTYYQNLLNNPKT